MRANRCSSSFFRHFASRGRDAILLPAMDIGRTGLTVLAMQPVEVTPIGTDLAIKWNDGSESFLPLETMRRFCPCASCLGEQDVFGNTYKPPARPYGPGAFQLVRLTPVGGYGVQPLWADRHGTGIYTWEYLRRLADGGEAHDR